MFPSTALRAGLLSSALIGLTGCDLLLIHPLMPGLVPGVGFPLSGQVLDSRTRLPIGAATVTAGLGTTLTDNEGKFSLYGSLSSRELSVSRAGYTIMTIGGRRLSPSEPLSFTLSPSFSNGGALPKRFIDLRGTMTNAADQRLLQDGLVTFAGRTTPISNGAFQIKYEAESPGKVLTSVLAGGLINGRYQEGVSVSQSFSYRTFAYQLMWLPLGETYPESVQDAKLALKGDVPIQNVRVQYTNLSGFTSVETDIALDFGLAGAIPVAHATGSNQSVPVPQISGLKYVVNGRALNEAGQSSTVSITTEDPGKTVFQLLSSPRVIAPASGAAGVGARPTFSWAPSTVPNVSYVLTLFEGDDFKPKWIGTTSDTSLTYPGFSPGDINGGALRADKKYKWNLRVVDELTITEQPTSVQDQPPGLRPLRSRRREADTRGYTFTL